MELDAPSDATLEAIETGFGGRGIAIRVQFGNSFDSVKLELPEGTEGHTEVLAALARVANARLDTIGLPPIEIAEVEEPDEWDEDERRARLGATEETPRETSLHTIEVMGGSMTIYLHFMDDTGLDVEIPKGSAELTDVLEVLTQVTNERLRTLALRGLAITEVDDDTYGPWDEESGE